MIRRAAFAYCLHFPYQLCLGSSHTFIWFNVAGECGEKKNFSRWMILLKLEVFWWYCPLKWGRNNSSLCFKHNVAPVSGPLKCTKCWGLRKYCSWRERMKPSQFEALGLTLTGTYIVKIKRVLLDHECKLRSPRPRKTIHEKFSADNSNVSQLFCSAEL